MGDDKRASHRLQRFRLKATVSGVAMLGLSLAVAAQPGMAQSAPANSDIMLEEIIVTAQKREQSLQDVPISIAVLGGKQLDQQATGGALEALLQVPGISQSSSDAGNLTQVSIRGVSPGVPYGAGSSTVGYYLDSIPFGLVRAAIVPNTNAYDMARIEVLRGPQGTLYGASALNGVVRLITNDADPLKSEFKARGGMSFTKGGEASYRADAAANIPLIEDKLAIRVVGGYESLGGWVEQPRRNVTDANDATSRSLRVKVAALPTEDLRVDLTAWFSRDAYDSANYADEDGNQSTTVEQPGVTKFQAYNAKIVYELPFMSISSATSYLDFHQDIKSDFSYVAGGAIPLQLSGDLPSTVFTEELLFSSAADGPWRKSVGFFYRDADGKSLQTLPGVLPGALNWRDASQSYAVFGELTRALADNTVELTGGLRYFHDKSSTDVLPGGFIPPKEETAKFKAVTPRFVATYLPSPTFTAFASYSQGFRSGLNQGPLALVSAPGLKPADADRLHNYEVGAKGSLLDGFAVYEASLFKIQWNKVQQIAQVIYNGAYTNATVNGSSASGLGAEASLTLKPSRAFQFGGSFSFNNLKQDADVTQPTPDPRNPSGPPVDVVLYPKGSRTAFSPKWTASAFASYDFAITDSVDGRFNASVNYRSSQELRLAVGTADIPAAVFKSDKPLIVNAGFDIMMQSGHTVSLFVQNLTNWDGITIPAPVNVTEVRYRPRTVGIQYEARF